MADFTPIDTQEAFDAAIKDRLARQETKIRGEYADYADLKKQSETWATEKQSYEQTIATNKTSFEDLTKQLADATGKIAQYEVDALKTKVAVESGLPIGMVSYLKGATEEEIRTSVEELSKFAKSSQVLPMASPEGERSAADSYELTGKVNEDRVRKQFIDAFKILEE